MKEMTAEERRAFLAHGTRTGKLATVRADGSPHAAPVCFVLDGDELDEAPFDIAFAIRVGALDGRHPAAGQKVLKRIAAAMAPGGRMFIDGGGPLREVSITRWVASRHGWRQPRPSLHASPRAGEPAPDSAVRPA